MKENSKRDDIMQAALDLIAERGFHGAPMAMIANRAEVGAGTIYRYFDSKDVLIAEMFKEMEEKILAVVLRGYRPEQPIRERFLYLCTTVLRYFVAHPLYFRFMEQFLNSPYGVSYRREKIMARSGKPDIFTEIFQQGIAGKELKDLPLYVHAALTFGPILSLVRDHTLGLIVLDDSLIDKCISACWDGIKK
ncbi:MAG: TetR family transcriptional regulator [Deltaproteobacteria bacterium HGW-Deltaproteobacteria-21]|nr:MAG: TetR family transcriptional regulator [Deltaproteobacteria bacterium HGW-Deltaproteobacteria-21]